VIFNPTPFPSPQNPRGFMIPETNGPWDRRAFELLPALHRNAHLKNAAEVFFLERSYWSPHAVNADGQTLLATAVKQMASHRDSRIEDAVVKLLDRGADPNQESALVLESGETMLFTPVEILFKLFSPHFQAGGRDELPRPVVEALLRSAVVWERPAHQQALLEFFSRLPEGGKLKGGSVLLVSHWKQAQLNSQLPPPALASRPSPRF